MPTTMPTPCEEIGGWATNTRIPAKPLTSRRSAANGRNNSKHDGLRPHFAQPHGQTSLRCIRFLRRRVTTKRKE